MNLLLRLPGDLSLPTSAVLAVLVLFGCRFYTIAWVANLPQQLDYRRLNLHLRQQALVLLL
jgi:hypothetical protein